MEILKKKKAKLINIDVTVICETPKILNYQDKIIKNISNITKLSNDDISIKDIVFVSLKGEYDKKGLEPSSEWRFHQDMYINQNNCNAIVHAHSINAVALSSHRINIPAFNYMVAVAGGFDIKCAEYETFGTRKLSKNILKALKGRRACLIANHGQIAYGASLDEAFELAEELENICKQYLIARQLGKPKILSLRQMEKVLIKFKNYKK